MTARPGTAGEADASLGGVIHVVLPVHDRREHTEAFVRQLVDQNDRGFRLVLIDDGSTDGTADAVRALLPEATVITGSGSWWWGGSLHQAYLRLRSEGVAEEDVVLIANDDTTIDRDFLETGRRVLARSPRALVLARLFRRDGSLKEVGAHVDWRRFRFRGVTDPAAVNCFSTRGLWLRARDFVALRGFHPRLLPHYLSDYEFTIRARRQGFRLVSDPELTLAYDERTTGVRDVVRTSGLAFLRQSFSRKSARNPTYFTTFVLLASPRRQLLGNLVRVWLRFLGDLVSAARSRR